MKKVSLLNTIAVRELATTLPKLKQFLQQPQFRKSPWGLLSFLSLDEFDSNKYNHTQTEKVLWILISGSPQKKYQNFSKNLFGLTLQIFIFFELLVDRFFLTFIFQKSFNFSTFPKKRRSLKTTYKFKSFNNLNILRNE